jgi:hypothetical protein
MNGVPLRTAARVVAALAAVGVARQGYFHLISEPVWRLPERWREARPEERYRTVRSALPAAGRVGYLTDLPVSTRPGVLESDELGTWLYQQAQYALAPLMLVYGDATTEVVLANMNDPARVDALAREHGLRVAERFHGGTVAVLRR